MPKLFKKFSVMALDAKVPGSKARETVLMGPARFVNHSCEPNVKVGLLFLIACSIITIVITY